MLVVAGTEPQFGWGVGDSGCSWGLGWEFPLISHARDSLDLGLNLWIKGPRLCIKAHALRAPVIVLSLDDRYMVIKVEGTTFFGDLHEHDGVISQAPIIVYFIVCFSFDLHGFFHIFFLELQAFSEGEP